MPRTTACASADKLPVDAPVADRRASGRASVEDDLTTSCTSADELPVEPLAADRRAAGRASVEDDRVHQCRRAAGRTVRSAPRALPVPPRPAAARHWDLALRDSVAWDLPAWDSPPAPPPW